ncbi:MAG: maltodextrin glucosidase [Anaerolineales bacterium]
MIDTHHWTAGVHHDGSALYVSNPTPKAEEVVTVRLRTPIDAPVRAVYLRTTPDGEAAYIEMGVEEDASPVRYWAADMPVTMPHNPYSFKLLTLEGAYYLTAAGISRAEKPSHSDFALLADYHMPGWVAETVFYQIFPDRFFNGDPSNDVQDGEMQLGQFTSHKREWGARPLPFSEGGSLDFYGGDLPGIAQKVDYLQDLGVNAIYLTPIFPAQSNHRYDIMDFYRIDPHLGGEEGLQTLRQALDAANMRLMLDVTPNHVSWKHIWFTTAQNDLNSPEAEYFTFYDEDPQKYEMWLGVPTLPKLNYASAALRQRMYAGEDAVLRHWLREPYRIDGWRLDVLNMTARQRMQQLDPDVGRGMRAAVKDENPEAFLLGEHFFDGTRHLQGDQLDATMNYQGFNFPLRRWLSGQDTGADHHMDDAVGYIDPTLLPSEAFAEQTRAYLAAVPWVIARQQFNQLGSHDTMRFLSALGGDTDLMRLAVGLLMTFPGVPCVYYGDEVGLDGYRDPDNRRCMPWDENDWNKDLRYFYRQVIRLRRTAHALKFGGFQWLYATEDVICYQRQSTQQRLVVVGYRGENASQHTAIPVWHAGLPEGMKLTDLLSGQTVRVTDGAIELTRVPSGGIYIFEAAKAVTQPLGGKR